ncbi:putative DNA methylase [environmental Halophage eHP-35]|nr:putative DNA methylase [environmental Halophage eHP-35]
MSKKIRFIDLFGGIGGFRHGLEQASDRYECVDYIENDEYAVKSYNEIFGEEHKPRDVTQLSKSEIKDHDLLCAGFPCQSFSVAGNRQGTDEARGKLFREIVRIAKAKKPEMLLLENVKGILSQKVVEDGGSVEGTKGHAFTEVLQALHELGYCLEWQVLNSKHWGVPQNRERVFIIGHLGGEPGRKVFPIGREDRGDTREDGQSENLDTVHPNRPEIGQAERVYENDGLLPALNGGWTPQIKAEGLNTTSDGASYCIDSNYMKGTSPGDIGSGRRTQIIQNHRNIEIRNHGRESPTLNKKQGGGQLPMILNHQFRPETLPSIEEEGQSGGSGLLYNSDYSYALSSSPHYKVGKKCIRKLTPKECWRLQGFPDESFKAAEKVNSDTQLYKQAGNAVTVNVIKALGEEIEVYFGEIDNEH